MRRNALIISVGIIILLVAIVALVSLLRPIGGQITTPITTPTPKEITITDVIGRNVTVSYPVKKVVVADDEVAELVELIGAAGRVVGIESSIRVRGYFPQMVDKPITGSQLRSLNYELIAKLKPDVVLMMDVGPIGKIIEKLEKIGVNCIIISIRPEKIPQTIEILGKIFGKEDRAKKILEWWNDKWSFLKERISKAKIETKLKVFVGMGFSPTNKLPTQTWGQLAYWNYILNTLKMVNIAAKKLKAHGELDIEFIANENPDVIIIGDWSNNWVGYTINSSKLAENMIKVVKEDPILHAVNAVKYNRVFVMDYTLLTSFRTVIGAYYLAKAVYPDIFKDIDPEEIHKEYFEKWLGVPYKGIWFYPRPWLGEG